MCFHFAKILFCLILLSQQLKCSFLSLTVYALGAWFTSQYSRRLLPSTVNVCVSVQYTFTSQYSKRLLPITFIHGIYMTT